MRSAADLLVNMAFDGLSLAKYFEKVMKLFLHKVNRDLFAKFGTVILLH